MAEHRGGGGEKLIIAELEEVRKAGERAAALTRQLLAFSRQQLLEPRTLELNQIVLGLEKMLRRLMGEDIELSLLLSHVLGKIHADPGQIEQIIMNLVVNARDAMPEGGKVSIESGNCQLTQAYTALHLGVTPGEHVIAGARHLADPSCAATATTSWKHRTGARRFSFARSTPPRSTCS